VFSISIVIPVFNEAENLLNLYRRLNSVLPTIGGDYEIVFVDDGSKDGSFEILKVLSQKDSKVKVIKLVKNFGQHSAILAGFERCKGEVVITLDADLQNPPEEISKLLRKMEEGYDVVAGWRKERKDPLSRRLYSFLFSFLVSCLLQKKLKDYGCMLRAYRRPIVEAILKAQEGTIFIPVLACQLGAKTVEVEVAHQRREAGQSKYGFFSLLKLKLKVLATFFPQAPKKPFRRILGQERYVIEETIPHILPSPPDWGKR